MIMDGGSLVLPEYHPVFLPEEALPESVGLEIYKKYGDKITVEFPSPINGRRWKFWNKGWIGFIPLDDVVLELKPRKGVELKNVVYMLGYVFGLTKSFFFLEGLVDCETLKEFFDRLAALLAKFAKQRIRRGLFKGYIDERQKLSVARGRIDAYQMAKKSWETTIPCHYQRHSVDIEENQILAWTLFKLARSGWCRPETQKLIRHTFRTLKGTVSVVPCTAKMCEKRQYNSLNGDYQRLHNLCRFFLENCSPALEAGEQAMVPFLIQTFQLFEKFVFAWLRDNLPEEYVVRDQHRYIIDESQLLKAHIDIVIFDRETDKALCVIDTKYKTGPIQNADLYQIAFYALSQGCQTAILLYPVEREYSLSSSVNNINLHSLEFLLRCDLREAGNRLQEKLLSLLSGPM